MKLINRQDLKGFTITCSTGSQFYSFFINKGKTRAHNFRIPRTSNLLEGYQKCYNWINNH